MELNEYDYSKSLNEKEENDLIEKFKNLKFFDPKIDSLFKQIFGNSSNKDIAISLINAVLPEKEIIEDLTFENTEIYSTSLDTNRRGLRIDIYAKNKEKNFIIEMQIHEIKDILGRSELAASRIFDRLYQVGDDIIPKEKIYCINFLYYDQFPEDKDYYHHLFTHEFNKKNISMPFKDIIVIELKKFKNNFSISEIKESVLNGQINKEIVRKLWFIFLSYINTIYYEPKNINSNQYFKIEKKRDRIKVKKVNEDVQNVNVKKKKDKTVIYVKNEIDENIYKLLIKVNAIRKALDLCINLSESDMENYVKNVELDMEHLIQIRNIKKEKDEEINKIKKEKNEEINKKNEEINKKMRK